MLPQLGAKALGHLSKLGVDDGKLVEHALEFEACRIGSHEMDQHQQLLPEVHCSLLCLRHLQTRVRRPTCCLWLVACMQIAAVVGRV